MTEGTQIAVFIDFENLALWAEREFFDFELTKLIEYLHTRGPAIVKRAYGDWSRFSRYRDDLMNNTIDLIQIYSVRGSKNRADIRMSIDALEIAMTRPHINTFVIVSGDSDFGPLVVKLREYGRYIIGIGPRSITHHLLVKSCDEFVYLETALGETTVTDDSCVEQEVARALLSKALLAHGKRGELPILATRLKQTMLLLDPSFNEANFGYTTFKSWLEDTRDLVKLVIKDLQLFAAPPDFIAQPDDEFISQEEKPIPQLPPSPPKPSLEEQYRQVLSRIKLSSVDMTTRRDVLRDIYREVQAKPGEYTPEELIEFLNDRYEALGFLRSKAILHDIFQMAHRQRAFDYKNQPYSIASPIWIAPGLESEADFVCRAEADIAYAIVRAGIELDPIELAFVLTNDRSQVDYVQCMLEGLKERDLVTHKERGYSLPGLGVVELANEPVLEVLVRDLEQIEIPYNAEVSAEAAHSLARKAMLQRSQDFVASGNNYLLACRLQWEAVERGEQGATNEDLRWFMASYASVIAGKLSQVNRDYSAARPYYLAFFALVQEDDPLWARMRGLINPMLSYYWANAGRELDINISSWNINMSSPAQVAVMAANHPNLDLRKQWTRLTEDLAQVNPGLLRRIVSQLMTSRSEGSENNRTAEVIESILLDHAPA